MRQIIDYSELLCNKSFAVWFLMINFPEGIDKSKDCSMAEIIEEKCTIDRNWIDDLTGYYDGIFDENDGYIENPKAIKLKLSTGDIFCVEFHPGDTIYYVNEDEIGCTGAEYSIKKISLSQFWEYTKNIGDAEKIFLLPMLRVCSDEKELLFKTAKSILHNVDLQECNVDDLCTCILENCLE